MYGANQENDADRAPLSPSVATALIDALFETPGPLLAGLLTAPIGAAISAYECASLPLWCCSGGLVLIALLRVFSIWKFRQHRAVAVAGTNVPWQRRHTIGAVIQAAGLGVWAAVTLLCVQEVAAHMVCLVLCTAIAAGGAGRSYGQPKLLQIQVLLVFVPIVIGLSSWGTFSYLGLALFGIVFIVSMVRISNNLHTIFLQALTARERAAALAEQFHAALNNMPHGLCMFHADGGVAVTNRRFKELMNLPEHAAREGFNLSDVIAAGIGSGSISSAIGKRVEAEIGQIQAKRGAGGGEDGRSGADEEARGTSVPRPGPRNITTGGGDEHKGRSLAWSVQPVADGGVVVLVQDVTESRLAEERIGRLARYDDLTGLPNRANFRDEIESALAQCQRRASLSSLLFVDLDHFKQVNDALGHPRGDQLLCQVANRMRGILRREEFVARFGGDEFVVFQRDINSPVDAATLARRIISCLSAPYWIEDHLVEIRASVGIALTSPGTTSFDTMLKNADMALYRAKTEGRGTYCFFREEMAASVKAQLIFEIELRKALVNEEFDLFYQPLVNLESGKITACEALLRWNHPRRGVVPPAEIIPVVEDLGLIADLGRWVLHHACMECMNWPEEVSVAVNVSPRQFHKRGLPNEIRRALEVSGLPAERLEIEITESSLLRNVQMTDDILSRLRALGVRISLDDFGTGYSSLSYLHSFPLQRIKIDRCFLDGIESDRPLRLLRGITRLSADLGMSVVVEGIETSEQLELIAADGTVTEGQGFLFGPPLPSFRVRELLWQGGVWKPRSATE
ncbi:MAG: EAL domain-containing protein [Alphaproteobacteria bacterium]|nr:EAL domain-containing protein [Alphaproteobacteria bacterium]